jgi:membrane protein YqaA with SNARE-associated domain
MEFLIEYGLIGLFIASFLAATILPLSSELVLSALILNGVSPELTVIIATTGNVLGSLTNYVLGFWASKTVLQKWLKMSDSDFSRAEAKFNKFGLPVLLFAWVPVIGDPLTVIAGMMRVRLIWFLVLVSIGKFLRYYAIANLLI